MKRVVTGSELSHHDVRPSELLDEYVKLVEEDLRRVGVVEAPATVRPCPGCGDDGHAELERLGFTYRRCARCASLWVSPLPDPSVLTRFRREGRAEGFWRDTVLARTSDARMRHALGPRVRWIAATASARLATSLTVCDVGAGDGRLEELLLASPVCGRYVRGDSAAGKSADVVVAFETLERALDVSAELVRCREFLRSHGLLFVSTLSGTGFEVQLLGARMRSLIPPLHLQLLSRAGWEVALGRAGLTIVEYSTPGELDVAAVAEALGHDPSLTLPPVLDELVRHEDADVARGLQELLQQAGLSAHVQFVASV